MKFPQQRMTRDEFICRLSAVLEARQVSENVRASIWGLVVVMSIVWLASVGLDPLVLLLLLWSSLLLMLDAILVVANAVNDENFFFEEVTPDER